MKEQLYTTFLAEDLTEEEVERFRRDWDQIDFDSVTIIIETSTEGSPAFLARTIYIPQEKSEQVIASFREGKLHELGWDKVFRLLPEPTPESDLREDRFYQPRRLEFASETLIDSST